MKPSLPLQILLVLCQTRVLDNNAAGTSSNLRWKPTDIKRKSVSAAWADAHCSNGGEEAAQLNSLKNDFLPQRGRNKRTVNRNRQILLCLFPFLSKQQTFCWCYCPLFIFGLEKNKNFQSTAEITCSTMTISNGDTEEKLMDYLQQVNFTFTRCNHSVEIVPLITFCNSFGKSQRSEHILGRPMHGHPQPEGKKWSWQTSELLAKKIRNRMESNVESLPTHGS